MGQAVKTYLDNTLSDVVLTASVRCFRRPGRSGAERDGVFEGGSRPDEGETRDPGTAGSFSAQKREPSFYRGLFGPLLRSALQGGIAYPRGLGPEGPDQKSNGCSPLNRSDPGTDPSTSLDLLRGVVAGQPSFDVFSSRFGS
jgi:hypothetical protein